MAQTPLTRTEFIDRAHEMHGDKYDYSEIIYKDCRTSVYIICPVHGKFQQSPRAHINNGSGCRFCGNELRGKNQTKNSESFIFRANKIHNNIYRYSDTEYKNAHTKVEIICSTHGTFLQSPDNHLAGHGCPKCISSISHEETQWLDTLGVPNEYRQKRLNINGSVISTDAYDPISNTIYEYWGDFWHGNPKIYNSYDKNPVCKKTYGELYDATQRKRNMILENGYKLIEIWGSEFGKNSDSYNAAI